MSVPPAVEPATGGPPPLNKRN
ncbi:hypothetical protein CGLO_14472 [Colletotrichum gloeosporioides Cg-14]|uniref:Uncharacterized protein n=1 Tax=Colletotrichum gloeosporioides (strain Cg-14) TaxID=1237896 RepID=T0JU84_COLGC|nr:hypothetical protein CGLO_14472 [Colletotrichum gloeosporioides Cg-14]